MKYTKPIKVKLNMVTNINKTKNKCSNIIIKPSIEINPHIFVSTVINIHMSRLNIRPVDIVMVDGNDTFCVTRHIFTSPRLKSSHTQTTCKIVPPPYHRYILYTLI